jgi:hypothetical protein
LTLIMINGRSIYDKEIFIGAISSTSKIII